MELPIIVSSLGYFAIIVCSSHGVSGQYQPNWASIDSRPLPAWYDEAKLGIFIHWGVFSVPSYCKSHAAAWFWYYWKGKLDPQTVPIQEFMQRNYRPDFTYQDFAKDFTAEFYDAVDWAKLFQASGAKYIVFVSKHHEGFTNWPSKYSFNWNSMDVGPNRDIVGELEVAIRNTTDLKFGLYHSMYEWFHPLYLRDKANKFTTKDFVLQKTLPELYEIVNKYKPDVVWSDGDWEAPSSYWSSTEFLAWLYNSSPVKDSVVVNDRWGAGAGCRHGGFFTCQDRYNPGKKQGHKFENAMTIDSVSWGFRRNAHIEDYQTMDELIATFVKTVSCGGNMLMNVGPTKYGTIPAILEERLRSFGQWLKVNGEAIYSSTPWTFQNDTNAHVWYTMKGSGSSKAVYAILLKWPTSNSLTLVDPIPGSTTVVTLLGFQGTFSFQQTGQRGINITVPPINYNLMPCQWAWVFKMTNIQN